MKTTAKKILSMLLCMCMVMSCLAVGGVYAADEEPPAPTHNYADPTWTWADDYSSATATFICTDEKCTDEQSVTDDAPQMTTVTQADCENDAVVTYKATVQFQEVEYTDETAEVTLDGTANGHNYADPTWEWADDYSSATATFVCTEEECADEQTVTDDAPQMTTVTQADCENDAVVTNKATVQFQEAEYSDETAEVTLDGTANGHDYADPTWTWADDYSSATATFKCQNCDDEQSVTDNAPQMTTVTQADCENDAVVTYKATVQFQEVEYTDETEEVADENTALHHEYVENVVDATCTTDGYTEYVCSRCGDMYRKDFDSAKGHDFGEWTQTDDPTCTEAGTLTCYCSRCDATQTKSIDALGHQYDAVKTEPTCTEKGYTTYTCQNCKDEYIYDLVPAKRHDFGEWTQTDDPTCTEAGTLTCYCSRCDATQTKPIDALGHQYDAVETEPTCTEKGYTTYTCQNCKDEYIYDLVPAKRHDFGEWTQTDDPTCTKAGTLTCYCSRCDATQTKPIDALGHQYDAVETKPTCTEKGYTTYTCRTCKDEYIYKLVPANGHNWGDGKGEVTAPTCIAKGYTTYTCIDCGYSRKDNYLDATGHNISTKLDDPESETHVITEAGFDTAETHTFYCKNCKGAIAGGMIVVKLTGTETREHRLLNWVDIGEGKCMSICEEDGCNKGLDGGPYTETREHSVDDDQWVYNGDATCFDNGTETGHCHRCNAEITRNKMTSEERDKIAHTYPTVVGEDGLKHTWMPVDESRHSRSCSTCAEAGKTVEDSVQFGEHTFTEWKYDEDESFFKNGHETRYCTDCGYKETREVAGSSTMRTIIAELLGASTFFAWLYTGFTFWIASLFGIPTDVIEIPFKH